jgi:hypothetical protein
MDSITGRRQDSSGRPINIINRDLQTPNNNLVFDWTSGGIVLGSIKLRAFRYTTDQTAEYIGSDMVPIPTATTTVTTGNGFTGPPTGIPTFTGRCGLNGNCGTKRSAVSLAAAESFQNVTLKGLLGNTHVAG